MSGKLRSVQVLRALAVVGVILFHYGRVALAAGAGALILAKFDLEEGRERRGDNRDMRCPETAKLNVDLVESARSRTMRLAPVIW